MNTDGKGKTTGDVAGDGIEITIAGGRSGSAPAGDFTAVFGSAFDVAGALAAAFDHHRAGRLAEAEAIYKRILDCQPDHADALHLLGMITYRRGGLDAAVDLIGRAIAADDAVANFHTNLGNVLAAKGLKQDAIAAYLRALALDPGSAIAHNNLGNAHLALGRLDEAEENYRAAIAQEPDYWPAHCNLGNALLRKQQHQAAAESYRQALRIKPDSAEALGNLGELRHLDGALGEAEELLQSAIAIDPGLVAAHSNLGALWMDLGRYDDACERLEHVQSLDPDYLPARTNLGLLALLRGEYATAWPFYAARQSVREHAGALWQEPLPRDLAGKHVLILKDQGLGDEIFFLRFAPVLKARGARITYCAGAKIVAILKRLPFLDEVVTSEAGLEAPDYKLSAGDLPLALGMVSAGDLPPVYSLPMEDGREAAMTRRLGELGPPPYIALTWRAGTPHEPGSIFKEAPAAVLARTLAAVSGTVVALQRNPEPGEIAAVTAALGRPVHDLTDLNDDLEDMLAALSLIDEYVTVSNTNVHLRCGVGRPSRVLVPNPPEWRWMAAGDQSPWFPGSPVYRQGVDGSWDGALARLARDLGGKG